MKLLSLKREVQQLKAVARSRCGSGCVCEYVEVVEGQAPTIEQQQILKNNQSCYQQHDNRELHVGWSSIIVPGKLRFI